MKTETHEDFARRRRKLRVFPERMAEVRAQGLAGCREARPCWMAWAEGDDYAGAAVCACKARRRKLQTWARMLRADMEFPNGPPQVIADSSPYEARGKLIYHQPFETRCFECDAIGLTWWASASILGTPRRIDAGCPDGWYRFTARVNAANLERVLKFGYGPGYGIGSVIETIVCPTCASPEAVRARAERDVAAENVPLVRDANGNALLPGDHVTALPAMKGDPLLTIDRVFERDGVGWVSAVGWPENGYGLGDCEATKVMKVPDAP